VARRHRDGEGAAIPLLRPFPTIELLGHRRDLYCRRPSGHFVLCAKVGSEFFITLGFAISLHFIDRFANDRTGRVKHPGTLRATVALKILVLNPDKRGSSACRTSRLRQPNSKGLWDGSYARRHHLEDRFIVEIASGERFTGIPSVCARARLLVSSARVKSRERLSGARLIPSQWPRWRQTSCPRGVLSAEHRNAARNSPREGRHM
jgi:hypothetical protein